jgi:hypothetical protein
MCARPGRSAGAAGAGARPAARACSRPRPDAGVGPEWARCVPGRLNLNGCPLPVLPRPRPEGPRAAGRSTVTCSSLQCAVNSRFLPVRARASRFVGRPQAQAPGFCCRSPIAGHNLAETRPHRAASGVPPGPATDRSSDCNLAACRVTVTVTEHAAAGGRLSDSEARPHLEPCAICYQEIMILTMISYVLNFL